MYKNIERKQRMIEAQNGSNEESSIIDDSDQNDIFHTSKNKLGLVNQIIFNSQFMDSIAKTHKRQYDKMDLEGLVDSFVRNSISHHEVSSFLNESNYSIFSKTNAKNITPQK